MGNVSLRTKLINWLKDNYINMPYPIAYMIGKIGNSFSYSIRYGKDFTKVRNQLKKTEFLSKDDLDQVVLDKLISMINYAYEHVPYYKENYAKCNVSQFHNFADIEKLPMIDKTIVKDHTEEFVSDCYSKEHLIKKYTSGSTGTPLGIYMDKETTLKEWAFVVHIWERIGFTHKSSRLIMREIDDKSKKQCYFDPIKNELRIDISAMTDDMMEKYCVAIEKYKPDFIHGYPSATILLCQYLEKNGPLKHKFKGVLPSSEGMTEDELKYIKKVLQCPVLSFYGHTERLVIAGQCEESNAYHVEPLYGYCELVDNEGNPINEYGVTGEIVATGFCNSAMPLIRYKTGDLAQWGEECEACGRHYRVLKKLEGRVTEYLVDNKENKIPLTSLRYTFYDQHIKAFQFYQEVPGEVSFRYIKESGFSDSDMEYIVKTLTDDANGKIKFELVEVNDISKKKSGKRELIIQKVTL